MSNFFLLSEKAYWISFYIFFLTSIPVLLILLFSKIKAPYGKFTSGLWGNITIPSNIGWIIMESPSSIIFAIYFIVFMIEKKISTVQIVLFIFWQFHYAYRSFIYPLFTPHSKKMPIGMMFSALSFQLINTYFQVVLIFGFASNSKYTDSQYLLSPYFIIGSLLFLSGSFINRQSDFILRALRKNNPNSYQIPYGGMFKLVSSPNYLGEFMIWAGWSFMTSSIVGLAFFTWTLANLLPRALQTHRWYIETFPNYPKNRKAVIPFIL